MVERLHIQVRARELPTGRQSNMKHPIMLPLYTATVLSTHMHAVTVRTNSNPM